ncbi:double-strand break repair protein AddB [Aestuariibius insulae]|uniref:double-strand break repair protein AddB n=1 Tax=Aestuariibius insulae TaxID=2058287 RepID=UPI00345ED92C
MTVPGSAARLFALPPGVDFPAELVAGLRQRWPEPLDLARAELFVNTRRMQRRIREVFDAGPAALLPQIRLVTDLGSDPALVPDAPPVSGMRRRLEVAQLIARLIEAEPDLAGRHKIFDLADSLVALIDEMQGEGVEPEAIRRLDVPDVSDHWIRALKFVEIAESYLAQSRETPDPEARLRRATEILIARWHKAPPEHPVLIAGSTGSRGTTALLMEAVARLPQGAVILPGFDFDLPEPVWATLEAALSSEDHPQYRFRKLMAALDLAPGQVLRWTETAAPSPQRNALVSLSLRPAPVTDQWMRDGVQLGDLQEAASGMTLLEAPSPRIEAAAIALRLREAADQGVRAALITPDRTLARQVTAALDRWRLTPDDSAGLPLHLSPPGRFLRHVLALGQPVQFDALLVCLKHPLAHSSEAGRGDHLRWVRELELHVRSEALAFPEAGKLRDWAETKPDATERLNWVSWICDLVESAPGRGDRALATHVADHLSLAERMAHGPGAEGSGALWLEAAGETAKAVCDQLRDEAEHGGAMSHLDYDALFGSILSREDVRRSEGAHPFIRIWGTLEARVQGADLVILGGLNDGSWPERPAPDPWLNRALRQEAGLLLPERRIGLSAHDYQQGAGAPEVWLTRSVRLDDADAVPSRWLNRLMNLMEGLPDQGGPGALAAMRERGADYLDWAKALDPVEPVPRARRPSPRPPVEARPKQLSVTRIQTLIRDPYAIYASRILGVSPLGPLHASPDALLRGTVIHRVLERFVAGWPYEEADAEAALMRIADETLAAEAPWPATRAMWRARLARIAGWIVRTEAERQAAGTPHRLEGKGRIALPGLDFTLTARADRIDRLGDGRVAIYDYKTGTPPTARQQKAFDKQLLLETAMVERGAFEDVPPGSSVAFARYIGLATPPATVDAPLDEVPPADVWDGLVALMTRWADEAQGYTARRAMEMTDYGGEFDHLSRFGEWDLSDLSVPERVG